VVEGDGRRARRERGRLAVLDATVDLIQELQGPPTAQDVAERAGVSVSSIFRYFDGLDELRTAAHARFFDRYQHLFEVPAIGEGPLGARIERFVTARVQLYDTVAPLSRLARARAFDLPEFAATVHQVRARLADQCRAHFAPELAPSSPARRDDLVGVLASLTSFESWDQLGDLGRTPRQIRRAWVRALGAVLSPA
jgi:AcrR family transcriptional regulator